MSPQRWQRIDSVFHAALEYEGENPDAFLRELCGDDFALYEEVHRMLDEHRREGPIDHAPWRVPAGATGLTETQGESEPVFRAGEIVSGRYRIVRFVSRGGMGEVYEADDLELESRVALKTLVPSIAADQRMIVRFKQELQLARKVAHPNVCRLFDFARHPIDGSTPATYFLTMEFLSGETLSARLQRDNRFSLETALPILQQMADALDAAHAAGVIHRDFKPSNVMLVPQGNGLRAVVTDFGLARNIHPNETTMTRSGQLMGTFEYMAPELFTGQAASVASDIYALGMVAFKMLTGALPSTVDMQAPPALPAALKDAPPEVAQAVESAIMRALDPRPGARFSSAGHFVQALRGQSAPSITITLSRSTRRVAIGGALVLVLGASVAGWRIWKANHGQPSPEAQVFFRQGVEEIQAGAYFGATKALEKAVAIAPGFSMAHARLAEAWLELLIPERGKDEMLAARRGVTTVSAVDRLQIEAIDFTLARDFNSAVQRLEQVHRSNPAVFEVDLGRAYEKAQRLNDALETYRRAAEGPVHNPAAWLRLGVIYSRMGKPEEAAKAFDRAEEAFRASDNFEGAIEVLFQRGIAANRRGVYADGVKYLEKARETAHIAGHLHQEIAAMLQLATAAYATGDADRAERYAREALDEAEANQMEILAIQGMLNLGQARFQKRDFEAAEKNYQHALDMAQRIGAFGVVALCRMTLATFYDQRNRPEDMLAQANAALKYFEANGHLAESAAGLIMVGRYQRNHDQLAAALGTLQQAADLAQKAKSRPLMAQTNASIGSILANQEQYPEALVWYRKNLDPATDSISRAYAGLQCANILRILGRLDEARKLLDETDALAQKLPTLRLRVRRSRAALALTAGSYADAIAASRELLQANGDLEPGERIEAKRIHGLALVGNGRKTEGLRWCDEALQAAPSLEDAGTLLSARMAALEAHLATSDKTGASAIFADLKPSLEARPESRWRAYALMSTIDAAYAAEARAGLDALLTSWGKDNADPYLRRDDVKRLVRHLPASQSANSGRN